MSLRSGLLRLCKEGALILWPLAPSASRPQKLPEMLFRVTWQLDAQNGNAALLQILGTDGECAARSSAYREPSFGHAIIDFINGTHAQWYWNRNQVPSLDQGPLCAHPSSDSAVMSMSIRS